MEGFLPVRQFFTCFHCIQKICCFIHIQSHDGFFVDLWCVHQRSRVGFDDLLFVIEFEHHAYRRQFTGLAFFIVVHFLAVLGIFMVRTDIVSQIFQKTVDILRRNFVQMIGSQILCFHAAQCAVFFVQITEEDAQVIGISQTSFCRCGLCNAAEKGLGESRKFLLDLSQAQGFFVFQFFMVSGHRDPPYSSETPSFQPFRGERLIAPNTFSCRLS